jgi:hypothetical protein
MGLLRSTRQISARTGEARMKPTMEKVEKAAENIMNIINSSLQEAINDGELPPDIKVIRFLISNNFDEIKLELDNGQDMIIELGLPQ